MTTPYSSAMRLVKANDVPKWLNEYDAQRLASYKLYEDIYWTNPNTFKLTQRGTEENPIYVPSGRIICNTMDRYAGVDWHPMMDSGYGTPEEQAAALAAMTGLVRRERLGSAYLANKLFGIIRGDWCWYITANPNKPEGSRITLKGIDPGMVFPINDENDVDRIFGYDLIEQIMWGNKTVIKRVRYLKSDSPDYPFGGAGQSGGPVSFQIDTMEVENWEDPSKQKIIKTDETVAPVQLPKEISKLPVYHIKNFEEPQNPFGISEMRGLERIMAAVNQSITDEELSLALEGLGMYKSAKGQPRDENGSLTTWQLGPGRVVHDESFERVNGINTVGPYQEHLHYLHSQMDQVAAQPDIAKGFVDVSVAESGIALAIRMNPILEASKKKDTSIKEVMDNMLYDLRAWFKAYEGLDMSNVMFDSVFGPKMPKDIKAQFDMLLKMYTADPPLITAAYFRDAMRELGMEIPVDVNGAAVASEQSAMQSVLDPYGARINQEIAAGDTPTPDPTNPDGAGG